MPTDEDTRLAATLAIVQAYPDDPHSARLLVIELLTSDEHGATDSEAREIFNRAIRNERRIRSRYRSSGGFER